MNTIKLRCDNCNTEFDKQMREYNRKIRMGKIKFYCCQSCASIHENILRPKTKSTTLSCLFCKREFVSSTHKNHKKCCSEDCAHKYSASFVDTQKLSETMKKLYEDGKIKVKTSPVQERKCIMCLESFCVKHWETKKTCSKKCYSKLISKNSKSTFERRVKEGTWTSWRKNTEPSYPEKFFMEVLKNNDIQYEYEYPIKRYSIDFAIHNKKIALEIDGQQHRFEDRVASDKKKDELLKSYGWKIYRIKWDGMNGNKRQEYIKSEIDKFISFYNSVQ